MTNYDTGYKGFTFLTVFLTPLLGATQGFGYQQAVAFGYEQIKVLFFIVSISLSGFAWFIYLMKNSQYKWSSISKAAVIFILILLVTSLMGLNPIQSLLGNQPYFQGWILYAYLFLFFLMVRISKIRLEQWADVLVGSAALVGILAIYDWTLLNLFHQSIPTYAGRVVSTFGQPNFYAGFLLLTLPFSYFLFKSQDKRLQFLGWGSGLVSLLGIMVSFSRSAILLSLLLIILGLIDQLKVKLRLVIFALALVLIGSLVALKFSSGFVGNEFAKPLLTKNPDLTQESVEKRVYIWPVAWQIFLDKPSTGYGLENISLGISNYFQFNKHKIFEENLNIQPVLISLKELTIDRTHNYILDLFVFSGVGGVISYLVLVFLSFKKLVNSRINLANTTLLVGFITYLIWIQFQNQSIVHLIYFWLLVGLIDCS